MSNKIKNYTLSSLIGKGSFSKVYKAYTNDEKYSIKIINMKNLGESVIDKIYSETDILRILDNENVLKLKEIIFDNECVFIVTQLCDGNLKQLLKTTILTFSEIKDIIIQIKNGLEYLYNKKIFHRDLKLENILYIKNKLTNKIYIKIADFGFAKYIDDMNNTLCGTPYYLSPEVLHNNTYHLKSDLWSIGIIFYFLVYKKYPFDKCINILELSKKIKSYNLTISKIDLYTTENDYLEYYDLITQLLEKNPEKRINWDNFFRHDFFSIKQLESSVLNLDGSIVLNLKKKITNIEDINIIDNYYPNTPISIPSSNLTITPSSSPHIFSLSDTINHSLDKSKDILMNVLEKTHNIIKFIIDK